MFCALKRTLTPALVAGVAAATMLVGAGAASATSAPAAGATATAVGCMVQAQMPARVSIDRPYREIKIPLKTNCDQDFAGFEVFNSGGTADVFIYEPAFNGAVDYWDLYSFDPVGRYYIREGFPEEQVVVSETLVKYGSRTNLTAKRSGNDITLTTCSSYYNGNWDEFRPWAGNKTVLQKIGRDGKSWQYVKTLGMDRNGCGKAVVTNKYASTYRAVSYDTYQVWSATSSNVVA